MGIVMNSLRDRKEALSLIVSRLWVAVVSVLVVTLFAPVGAQVEEAERVVESSRVLDEIMEASDSGVPGSIMDKADAIAIFPSTLKAGFIFGGHRGHGVISARDEETGDWSVPAFLTLTGGSFGLQIGAQSVDVVLVNMNPRGLESLLQNQFKIGGDASAVVGPVGRDLEASTDIQLQAEILSYSRTRGLFAGVSLEGADDPGRPRCERAVLWLSPSLCGHRARGQRR